MSGRACRLIVAPRPVRCGLAGAVPLVLALGLPLTAGCDRGAAGPRFPSPEPEVVAASEALGDPHGGRYPLDDALADLPPGESLIATLHTDEGEVECRLDIRHAPLTVASFVGLARGLRPYRGEDETWRVEPYYVDMPWHRALEGQLVQTGRRGRLAHGGFFLQDEVSYGDSFDRAGVLAMANAGSEHSGSVQFFVTTGPAPHLEGEHTIFGACDGEAVLRRIERRVLAGGGAPNPRLLRIDVTRR